jgi:hypothetical protein
MSTSELTVEQVGLVPAPDDALSLARGVLDETTLAQFGSCVEHALNRAVDAAVTDLREQLRALQTQLRRERAETAWLRDEVAQLRIQTREHFELNTAVPQSAMGCLSLEESVAEATSRAMLLINRDGDATGAIAVLKNWRGASPEIDAN